jgi:hypothetical protein
MRFNIEYGSGAYIIRTMLTRDSDLPVLFPYPRIYPGKIRDAARKAVPEY